VAQPGAVTGFIKFGTLAHRIVILMKERGEPLSIRQIMDYLDDPSVNTKTCHDSLRRLIVGGFVYKSPTLVGTGRTAYYTYYLDPFPEPVKPPPPIPKNPITNVFDFRGEIKL
jgi:hypothetical protein